MPLTSDPPPLYIIKGAYRGGADQAQLFPVTGPLVAAVRTSDTPARHPKHQLAEDSTIIPFFVIRTALFDGSLHMRSLRLGIVLIPDITEQTRTSSPPAALVGDSVAAFVGPPKEIPRGEFTGPFLMLPEVLTKRSERTERDTVVDHHSTYVFDASGRSTSGRTPSAVPDAEKIAQALLRVPEAASASPFEADLVLTPSRRHLVNESWPIAVPGDRIEFHAGQRFARRGPSTRSVLVIPTARSLSQTATPPSTLSHQL